MPQTKYLFDNAAEREARARMTALAAQHNDATFRYMEKCGIAPGWNCLEIGAARLEPYARPGSGSSFPSREPGEGRHSFLKGLYP